MFFPERILGGLIRRGIRNELGSPTTMALGMGALGVAIAAYDHFMSQQAAPATGPAIAIPPSSSGASTPAVPPPPPGSPPPPPDAADHRREAILLIQAMIAAAHADGTMDPEERSRILQQLESLALSVEERSFVMEALLNPVGLEAIAKQVDSPELARQVYTVSCLAIRIDTDQEHAYLQELAQRLSISKSDRENIRRELGQT